MQGLKKHGQGSKKHWAHLINKVHIYFIFSIGGLGFWNLKIYEWIGVQISFWKIYEWIGRYTSELWFRFFFGGEIYEWIGRYTNELGFRFFWKIHEWIGRYTNELWFSFFFGKINIYFIFSIGGLGFWNPKIYELIGRYTNELGFISFKFAVIFILACLAFVHVLLENILNSNWTCLFRFLLKFAYKDQFPSSFSLKLFPMFVGIVLFRHAPKTAAPLWSIGRA